MKVNSQGAVSPATDAVDMTTSGSDRYVALVRIDVEPSGTSATQHSSGCRTRPVATYRQLLGGLLKGSDAVVLSTGPGSVIVELAAPSRALAFAARAMRVLSMSGFEGKAALHVAWVTGSGKALGCEGLRDLGFAIDVARTGQVVATEQVRMLAQGDTRVWKPVNRREPSSVELYELADRPAAVDLRATSGSISAAGRRKRLARSLSRREREVAGLVAKGKSNREVASALRIAPSTVERHVSNLFGKLNVNSRVAVAVIAASGQL